MFPVERIMKQSFRKIQSTRQRRISISHHLGCGFGVKSGVIGVLREFRKSVRC